MAMATTAHSFTPAVACSNSISSNNRAFSKVGGCASGDSFPAGLRVLVVDDDPICLLILDRMLRRCQYQVTTCGRATEALMMLRENRDNFDVIISDVYMPDMDGFKLLELVGLEMDLPVIMMSANGETSAVMKGIKHGACDYLLKPVRMEELRNIWQHVVRKKWRSPTQQVVSAEDEKSRQGGDDAEHNSSANEGYEGAWKQNKKRRDFKEEEEEADLDPDDPSATKKPRVVWSVELHQQFVNAVNQLGIDKAVPKRILELMNVHGLTRENVASHLQKYRLYLKRISGVTHESGSMNSSFPVTADANFGPINGAGLAEFRAMHSPNELSSQALLSTLQAGVLGRLGQANNLGIGNIDKANLLQIAALQSGGTLGRPPLLQSYGQPLSNNHVVFQSGQCEANPIQLSQFGGFSSVPREKVPLGLSALQQQQLEAAASLGELGQLAGVNNALQQLNPNANALLLQALQQQQVGGSMLSKGGLNIPTNGNTGQQGLSTDAGVWATAISSLNGNIRLPSGMAGQYGVSSRLGSIHSAAGSPTVAGSLGGMTDVEGKGQQGLSTDAGVWGASISSLNTTSSKVSGMSGPNSGLMEYGSGECTDSAVPVSLERAVNAENKHMPSSGNVMVVNHLAVSSPLTGSGPAGLSYSRLKDLGSSLSSLTSASPRSIGCGFPTFSGSQQTSHTGQTSQGSWQGFSLGQEYCHAGNNAIQSPSYSLGSSGSQSLRFASNQEHSEPHNHGFGMGFSGNHMDHTKALQSDQLRTESGLQTRNEGHGWLPEPASDELLNIVLRQQQEVLGLTE